MNSDNLLVLIALEALVSERAGMEAENAQRQHEGCSMAYHAEAFDALAERIRELRIQVKADHP